MYSCQYDNCSWAPCYYSSVNLCMISVDCLFRFFWNSSISSMRIRFISGRLSPRRSRSVTLSMFSSSSCLWCPAEMVPRLFSMYSDVRTIWLTSTYRLLMNARQRKKVRLASCTCSRSYLTSDNTYVFILLATSFAVIAALLKGLLMF